MTASDKSKHLPDPERLGPDAASSPDTYEIGYCKPPRATQFKPGHSGNPKGRPKDNPTVAEIFRKIFWGKVQMRTGNKIERVPRLEAIMLKLMESSLKGDVRATTNLLKISTSLGIFKQTIDSRLGDIANANDGDIFRRLSDDELNRLCKLVEKLG